MRATRRLGLLIAEITSAVFIGVDTDVVVGVGVCDSDSDVDDDASTA